MPVLRYFLWMGGALLALLFVANAWLPATPAPDSRIKTSQASADLSIRIASDRKLPDKVVLDTNIPTIVPPPPVVAELTPPVKTVTDATPKVRVREAYAQWPSGSNQPQPAKPQKRKLQARNHHPMPRFVVVAQQPRFGFFGSIW